MAARCTKHSFEQAAAQCRSCGEVFCDDCLVYTHGPSSPPYCVPCALVAAGVRRVSGAEKKAMKAARHKKVDVAVAAPAAVAVTDAGEPVVEPDVAPAKAGVARYPLAWVAIVVGLLLLLVPLVTGNA